MSDIQDNEPKWLPPCSECAECNGRGGRWDEEAIDQWYWCRHCDAAEKEAMNRPVSNADELDRLRAEVAALKAERDEARSAHDLSQRFNRCLCNALVEVKRMAAQRTAERDDARREVCYGYGPMAEALAAAKRRGWDCFDAKEGKP